MILLNLNHQTHCRVVKLADMPSSLGGGDKG